MKKRRRERTKRRRKGYPTHSPPSPHFSMFRTTRKRSQTETDGGRERESKNEETKKDNRDLPQKVANNTPQKEKVMAKDNDEMRGEI